MKFLILLLTTVSLSSFAGNGQGSIGNSISNSNLLSLGNSQGNFGSARLVNEKAQGIYEDASVGTILLVKIIDAAIYENNGQGTMGNSVGTFGGSVGTMGGNQGGNLLTGNGSGTMLTVFKKDLNQITSNSRTQKVLLLNQDNSIVEFATATPVNGQWEVRKFAVPKEALIKSNFENSFRQSDELKQWTDLNN